MVRRRLSFMVFLIVGLSILGFAVVGIVLSTWAEKWARRDVPVAAHSHPVSERIWLENEDT
jgi:hypothetical protein